MREMVLGVAWITLILVLVLAAALPVIRFLYFVPGSPARRRMPRWLIICVLVSFLVLPQIDTVYALSHLNKKAKQVA